MFICITNIKKYNVKISDTIACRNVLFTNNLKKNKHTWLCKTPVPIYPVIEPIDTTFYIVIWLRIALEPQWWIWVVPLLGTFNLYVNASENHVYSISKVLTLKKLTALPFLQQKQIGEGFAKAIILTKLWNYP